MHQVGERLFSTKIDELRITPFGLWIIKHDNYVGEKCRERAQEYATWVYFVRQAFAPQDVQCLVHFPFSAAVVALT